MIVRLLALLLAPLVVAAPLAGQLRLDPISGDYSVTIRNDQGQLVELRVVPPNKVRVSVNARIEPGAGTLLRYVYAVSVDASSPQPLRFFRFPCGASGAFQDFRAVVTVRGVTSPWRAMHTEWMAELTCSFEGGAGSLEQGGVLQGSFETTTLPGLGEVRAFGRTPGVAWPTSDPIPENEEARRLVASISGLTGGWKSLRAVVPQRQPSQFADPAHGLLLVQSDLSEVCGTLGWITNAGVCHSLAEKLDHAAHALARGKPDDAKRRLKSFLHELAAQHRAKAEEQEEEHEDRDHEGEAEPERERGKHVTDNAFWLLKINAEFILARL